jgi:hypothetical protein
MQSNISLIYQQHIRPLSKEDQLELLAEMAKGLANGVEVSEQPKKRSLMELEGLGAEIWEGIDPDEYVNALRNEWDHRP